MNNYSFVSVPSTFPSSRRPIYLHPIADVTHKNKTEAYPLVAKAIATIANRHPDDRILVHTVSYDLAEYIKNQSQVDKTRFVIYTDGTGRQRAIDKYLTTDGSILLASSLDRGIDLPGNSCRAIVVCKIPYPNLGDKQVSQRVHTRGGQLWYSVQTVRRLVQSTGRGMRDVDDYCESYVLDRQFISNIWRRNKNLIPGWWSEALVWDHGKLI